MTRERAETGEWVIVCPNQRARSQLLNYKEKATAEWKAKEGKE